MDLGIKGRKAIVCASSHGLGKGCAMALAQAGVTLVINGRDQATLERTAQEIRSATGATPLQEKRPGDQSHERQGPLPV